MKHLGLLFLCLLTAFPSFAQPDFLTGQAAREVFGQPTFTYEGAGSPSAAQLGGVDGIAYANNTIFIVDSNHIQVPPVNNRVMIYNNISQYIYNPTDPIPQGSGCPVCIANSDVGEASLVLGQPDFTTTTDPYTTQSGFRNPTGIATDGNILVLADTDNNRVLIWNTIPSTIDQPADVVLGQPDFTTVQPIALNNKQFRGPEGVWIQGSRLFVADTQNHRVMIWNSIPTANDQPADLVLGEPNFTTSVPATTSDLPPTASNLFSPVSVTSDGQHVFVTDLGHHRVLIWNSIPTQNGQAADVVVGQPNMTTEGDNNYGGTCVTNGTDSDGYPTFPSGCQTFCASVGTDSDNNPTYPIRCGYTLSYPRFALSDGQRLFIADGGNDRIMVYNTIPTTNGAKSSRELGQPDEWTDQVTSSTDTFRPDANILESAPNTIRTPLALAWDGTNLYASDPFDDRVLVFTPGSPNVPINGITNAYSLNTYAVGTVSLSLSLSSTGTATTVTAGDMIEISITPPGASTSTNYTYTVVSSDTLISIVQNLANLINGTNGGTPDPDVIATANIVEGTLFDLNLTARLPGLDGNNIGYAATVTPATSGGTATEIATAAGSALSGGAAAAELAPGTLVSIFGKNLSDVTAGAVPSSTGFYPTTFDGVQVYFNGIRSPIIFISPTQINAQLPFEVANTNGVSAVVRTVHNDGSVTATNAIGVPVVLENPGILAGGGEDPRPVIAFHTSGNAVALVDIDGSATAGNVATLTIDNNSYSYTVQEDDTLQTVRDAFISLVNANSNERVTAAPAGEYDRIILTAKVAGPAGNGIPVGGTVSTDATIVVSVLDSGSTCCANIPGSLVTADNPAVPGEVITIYATGIGPTTLEDGVTQAAVTGQVYQGPALNVPSTAVDNAQVGGTTANVLFAGLQPGMLGVYQVQLQLDSSLGTNLLTQMWIAQNVFTSNIVTIPVVAQVAPASTSSARPEGANLHKRVQRAPVVPGR
ncbi:MAG TPA: IPT/TIG domain-containing protein [Bryobacteraceae bacterium]|nr:IPT/TIG domain-containing protein [Bryobacteraceae bacterium]